MRRFGTLCATIFTFFLLFTPVPTHAKHGQTPEWVDKSTDLRDTRCCGSMDCIPVFSVQVLETGAGYTDIMINGIFGVVHDYSVRTPQCPQDDPRPFVCLNHQFMNGQKEWEGCAIENPDGTYTLAINPACIRCVLTPLCSENYS